MNGYTMKNNENGGDKHSNVYSFSDLFGHDFGELEGDEQVYTSVDQLPKDPQRGDLHRVRFSMFRTGKWEHPWYGEIDFDREYLNTLKENFDRGVVPRRIGFDLEHTRNQGEVGNVGWMEALELREGQVMTPAGPKEVVFLDVVAAFNKLGSELLVDRRYAHCSAEIHPDFSTNEKVDIEVDDGDGNKEKTSTVFSHGPTVIGCALTNRPFIPSLGEVIEFSADKGGEDEELYDITMSDDDSTGIRFFSCRKFDEEDIQSFEDPVEDAQTFNEGDSAEPGQGVADEDSSEENSQVEENEQPNEGDKMKLSELMKKVKAFSTPSEQLGYLQEVSSKFSGDGAELIQELIATKQYAVQQEEDAKAQIAEAAQRKKQAEKRAQEYQAKVTDLTVELADAKEGEWEQRVQNFGAQLRDANHHESLVKVVTTKLSAINSETRAQKFSVVGDEETKEESLLEILEQCFSAIPESARLDTSTNLEGNQEYEVDPEGGNVSPADAGEADEGSGEDGSDEDALRQKRIEAYKAVHDGAEPQEFMIPAINAETGALDMDKLDQ